jgi:RNA polymerase sigma-70 factor (ECF subfamily)
MENERVWIERALAGDESAFASLVEAYSTPVYNLAYRLLGQPADAEDAAQETFLRVYTRLSTYRPDQKVSSWILSIASHHCIDRLRRRHVTWLSLDELSVEQGGEAPGPEESVLQHESEEQVQRLLTSLPQAYRLVIVLRYWYDLSCQEIVQVTGSSENAVKTQLHRARKMLKEKMLRVKDAPRLSTRPEARAEGMGAGSSARPEEQRNGVPRSQRSHVVVP